MINTPELCDLAQPILIPAASYLTEKNPKQPSVSWKLYWHVSQNTDDEHNVSKSQDVILGPWKCAL